MKNDKKKARGPKRDAASPRRVERHVVRPFQFINLKSARECLQYMAIILDRKEYTMKQKLTSLNIAVLEMSLFGKRRTAKRT